MALLVEFAFAESTFRLVDAGGQCLRGDGGKALGLFQLQHTPEALACAPATAARLWLAMAHASTKRCSSLEPDEQLAALTSGSCDRGRQVSRRRMRAARALLAR